MTSIFYDLETTDTHPIGQILNYCFISVDDRYQIREECTGSIRVSRTQLPRAGAILANRTDMAQHQKESALDEKQAMFEISSFLTRIIEESKGRVPLVGYNSSRFDLPFLRTSLMRYGIAPYFRGRLVYRDLLQIVRKLSMTHPRFPRVAADDASRLSLRLETLTKQFGLLQGKQTHFSRDDVLITIQLARHLATSFGADVRSTECYEGLAYHEEARSGQVRWVMTPEYELNEKSPMRTFPAVLLDANNYSALWVNLERFAVNQDQTSIFWVSASTGELFFAPKGTRTKKEISELSELALSTFAEVNLGNFFPKSTCDIEQDIYRLHANMDFSPLDGLAEAIWHGDLAKLSRVSSRDARVLYRRYELNQYSYGGPEDKRIDKMLHAYAKYRYGGQLQLSKTNGENAKFHPTLDELFQEISERKEDASAEDLKLLNHLELFYRSSDLYRVLSAKQQAA